MSDYDIRTIGSDIAIALRTALLDRSADGLADRTPGDDSPTARHIGAYYEGTLVGVASIHPQSMPGGYTAGAWRLTGVAVEHGHRGYGVGSLLVGKVLEHAASADSRVVWCFAPAGAFGFFQRHGFNRSGEPMESAEGGPQYLLFAEVGPLRRSWAL